MDWLEAYRQNGYAHWGALVTPAEVALARAEVQRLIDQSFEGVQVEQNHSDAVRKLTLYTRASAPLRALSEKPALLANVERIVGEKAVLVVDNALLKPARVGSEKPWHQDLALLDYPPDMPLVGVWIALDRADEGNGCMYVVPGSHRQGPLSHFRLPLEWQLCPGDVVPADAVPLPLDPGQAVAWDGLTVHGSPANTSDRPRWALQFHYAPASVAPADRSVRLAAFAGSRHGKEC